MTVVVNTRDRVASVCILLQRNSTGKSLIGQVSKVDDSHGTRCALRTIPFKILENVNSLKIVSFFAI